MPSITIQADTIEDLDKLLARFVPMASPRKSSNSTETASSWQSFVKARSPNQREIIEALQSAGGKIGLEDLKNKLGLDGRRLSGTLGSLQKAANNFFGKPVIQPGPWFQDDRGVWVREYTLDAEFQGASGN